MKSSDNMAGICLYAALFKDIVAWDSGLLSSLDADLKRLTRLVETRGEPIIMIDLPDMGRVFDKALSTEYMNPELIPPTLGKVKNRASREFLSGMLTRVFSQDTGRLYDGVDPTLIFFIRQVCYMLKKIKERCSDAAISQEVDSFRKVDGGLRAPDLDWESDRLPIPRKRLSFRDGYRRVPDLVSSRDVCPEPLLSALDRISGIVVSSIPEFDWRTIIPRHGPGASAEAGRYKIDKYLFPHWPAKLDGVFPFDYFATSVGDMLPHESMASISTPMDAQRDLFGHAESQTELRSYGRQEPRHHLALHEPSARLVDVPKTLKGPRMIAAEPVSHVFIQLGCMRWLRENLPSYLRTSIHFRRQDLSREFCLQSSTSSDLATVDLSAASDRLSCWTVERIFQYNPALLSALHAMRTRTLVNSIKGTSPYYLRLRKFACMGRHPNLGG